MSANKKSGAPPRGVIKFYIDVLSTLNASKIPFLVGGTYAVHSYAGIDRKTKDLDVFCRSGDHIRVLEHFREQGYKTAILDERWLGKIKRRNYECDIIFGIANAMLPINDEWFNEKRNVELFGVAVPILSPTELIWSKAVVQGRDKNDIPDVMHIMFTKHADINWRRLLSHMEQYWEMLLIFILYFRFVYPSEREKIPRWLLDELLGRLDHQMQLPTPQKRICRGRLVSRGDYEIDIKKWGFEDLTA